jgi:hypothetical protein
VHARLLPEAGAAGSLPNHRHRMTDSFFTIGHSTRTLLDFVEVLRTYKIVRVTEPDFALVECFMPGGNCLISPRCRLRGVLKEALAAFVATPDSYTLADLMISPRSFGIRPAA